MKQKQAMTRVSTSLASTTHHEFIEAKLRGLRARNASISFFSVSQTGSGFRLQTAFEMGQLSDFVGSNVTTSLMPPDANGNILPKLPVCQTSSFGSFSYCAIVYYDNSVTSFLN